MSSYSELPELRLIDPHSKHALPNGVREAMLQDHQARGLVVVEGLYMLKVRAHAWLTFKQLYTLLSSNLRMSYQLVYKGLQCKLVFQRRIKPNKAYQAGRPAYLYRVPHPDELIAEFAPDAENTPSDTLLRRDLQSVSAYRKGLHREMFARRWCENNGKGFQMYRGLMADRLGVSKRTVRSYDKQLGFSNTPNFDEEEITWHNCHTLPRYKDAYDERGKPKPRPEWLKVVDWSKPGGEGRIAFYPLVRYLAIHALRDGKDVYKMKRIANTYYPFIDSKREKYDVTLEGYLETMKIRNDAGFYRKDDKWYYRRE